MTKNATNLIIPAFVAVFALASLDSAPALAKKAAKKSYSSSAAAAAAAVANQLPRTQGGPV